MEGDEQADPGLPEAEDRRDQVVTRNHRRDDEAERAGHRGVNRASLPLPTAAARATASCRKQEMKPRIEARSRPKIRTIWGVLRT